MANFSAITFSRLKSEVERYLKEEHNKSNVLYNPSSPYGQILSVLENLHQLSMLYLKNAINQFDLSQVNSNNERVIRNAAILAGHIPFRSISSSGTLEITPLSSAKKEELPQRLIIQDKTTIKNKRNSLYYSIQLNTIGDFPITNQNGSYKSIPINVIQGKWEIKTFTGDGTIMQTINIQEVGEKDIENFNYDVKVNGSVWTTKMHLYDLLPDEQACIVRTGFNGGIDVVFGNGGFGKVPPLGSRIEIRYLVSDGVMGNIYNRSDEWDFINDVTDQDGNLVDIAKLFSVTIKTDISFGADKENYLFTKNVLPIATNNFVLALPQHYEYELKRLGIFTYVSAKFKDSSSGTIFLYLVPNISIFSKDQDYFTIPLSETRTANGVITTSSAFTLDSYEIQKIENYLKSSGRIQLSQKIFITSPSISQYAIRIWANRYDDVSDESDLKRKMISSISDYFLNLKVRRRVDGKGAVPVSDIINTLIALPDLESVKVQFISKKNEDYHIEGAKSLNNRAAIQSSSFAVDLSNPNSMSVYDPNKVIGLDTQLGDIVFDLEQYPVIRGGWMDRYGRTYSDIAPNGDSGNLPPERTSIEITFETILPASSRKPI